METAPRPLPGFWLLLLLALAVPPLCAGDPAIPPPLSLPGSGPELEQNLPAGFRRLRLGDPAPDFRLRGVDDQMHSLAEFAGAKYLLVVFLSNHCPFSHAAETRLLPWIERQRANGLAVVAIQPNHPDSLTVDELGYSKYNDSFEEMKLYAREKGFTFPYLYDGDTQEVARRYGALATPDLFLFDADRRLQYSGRFDDSRFEDPRTVQQPDAIRAFEDLLAGRPVAVPATRPMGCSVKWLSKSTHAAQENAGSWEHAPIVVEPVTAAAVAELARNATKKFRLVNVWATWCAPCVAEMPELGKLARRLKRRDFEIVTISLDQPGDRAKAAAFLNRQHVGTPPRIQRTLGAEHRTTNHYLFADSSTDDLIRALDPAWPGPLPHTVLIAPGGQVVWRHNGAFDPVELGRVILDQLGGFYPKE